jgi:O-antigen/teichoic acid export membrane protein
VLTESPPAPPQGQDRAADQPPKRGLLRAASVYGASNVLERLIPVLLLPILTYYLTPADVGMLALFTAATNLIALFVGLNVSYAVRRRYFDAARERFPRYVGNCLMIIGAGLVLALLVVTIGDGALARVAGLPRRWLAAAVLLAASQELLMVPLTIFQVERQPTRYARVQVGRSAGVAALTALFVIGFGLGWQGAAAAQLVTTATFVLVVGLPTLKQWVEFRYDRADVAHAVRFGGGLIPHTLGTLAMRTADRFVISYYLGAYENGLYSVGYQVGFAVAVAADAFNRAWSPWLYAGLAENDAATDRRIVRMTYAYFGGIAAFTAILSIVAPPVMHRVLAADFQGAGRYVWWIALGFAFNGMYTVLSGFIFYSERTLVISWITGISSIVNLALNVVLVPRYGAIGSAQATAFAFLLRFVLTWAAGHRLRPMPWRLSLSR